MRTSKNARQLNSSLYGLMKGRGNFRRIYNDALLLIKIATEHPEWGYISTSCLPRNAIILLVIALEALANRLISDAESNLGVGIENEQATLKEKLKSIVAKHPKSTGNSINPNSKLWMGLMDLIQWRHGYIHPKSEIPEYFRAIKSREGFWQYETMRLSEIPKKHRILFRNKTTQKTFGSLGLPSSPTEIELSHAKSARQLIDDVIKKLDEKLNGYLDESGFLREEDEGDIYYSDGRRDYIRMTRGLDVGMNRPFGPLD